MELLHQENYNIKGYLKETILNELGDVSKTNYYKNYNAEENSFSNLKVAETRIITRNSLGIPISRILNIKFYKGDTIIHEKNIPKYYTTEQGLAKNKKASKNLIDKAGIYLMSQIGMEDAKLVLRQIGTEIGLYVEQDRQPVLDAITTLTVGDEIKNSLTAILDVKYTPEL